MYSYPTESFTCAVPVLYVPNACYKKPSVQLLHAYIALKKKVMYEQILVLQWVSIQHSKIILEYFCFKDYIPSHQDILHARKATKGITEFFISINNIPFQFVDVGGQRSQRQKWFQCFDSVTSILFLVSSSEFDQVLLEDRSVIN